MWYHQKHNKLFVPFLFCSAVSFCALFTNIMPIQKIICINSFIQKREEKESIPKMVVVVLCMVVAMLLMMRVSITIFSSWKTNYRILGCRVSISRLSVPLFDILPKSYHSVVSYFFQEEVQFYISLSQQMSAVEVKVCSFGGNVEALARIYMHALVSMKNYDLTTTTTIFLFLSYTTYFKYIYSDLP